MRIPAKDKMDCPACGRRLLSARHNDWSKFDCTKCRAEYWKLPDNRFWYAKYKKGKRSWIAVPVGCLMIASTQWYGWRIP